MFRHAKKTTVTFAALAATALGAGAVAQAGSTPTKPAQAAEQVSVPDRDTIQSGDQTTPDTKAASASSSTSPVAARATPEPGGNAPEKPGAESSEAPGAESSESAPSDGPGGYADSNPAADTQQQGVN